MNKTANKLLLKNTMFNNPHGLCDKANKSCAADLGRLSYFFIQNAFLKKVVNSKSYISLYKNAEGTEKVQE